MTEYGLGVEVEVLSILLGSIVGAHARSYFSIEQYLEPCLRFHESDQVKTKTP